MPDTSAQRIVSLSATGMITGYSNFKITDINFELRGGDILGLLGRSGSGKSTIINTLTGSIHASAGYLIFQAGDEKTQLRQSIGYSPQKNALYPFLTVRENLQTFAELYGVGQKDIDQRTKDLLERLDLTAHIDKRITQLSGGMEKRVDLAVTLIHNPDVIILDEPFNGLDISLQRFIWELLRELASQGRIIIITSHLLDDIQRYCTRFGLVENGKFYCDADLRKAVQQRGGSLQNFLEQMFTRDLVMEEAEKKSK